MRCFKCAESQGGDAHLAGWQGRGLLNLCLPGPSLQDQCHKESGQPLLFEGQYQLNILGGNVTALFRKLNCPRFLPLLSEVGVAISPGPLLCLNLISLNSEDWICECFGLITGADPSRCLLRDCSTRDTRRLHWLIFKVPWTLGLSIVECFVMSSLLSITLALFQVNLLHTGSSPSSF